MDGHKEVELLEILENETENNKLPQESLNFDVFKKQICVNNKSLNLIHINIHSIRKNI